MKVATRRWRSAVALAVGLGTGALTGAGAVLAHHIPSATYTGGVTGGGTITLVVSADGTKVDITVASVPSPDTNCLLGMGLPNTAIADHAFARTSATGSTVSGTFGSAQGASGDVRMLQSPCDSGPETWSATTSSPAVDSDPPDTQITSGPSGLINDRNPQFSFTSSEPNSTFECSLDSAAFAACNSPSGPSSPLSDGPHTFRVRATDQAQNTDPTPAERSVTVDATPPDTLIDGSPPTVSPVTIGFHATEPASFRCSLDGAAQIQCTPPYQGPVGSGPHTFSVFAIDAAGNADPSPANMSFTIGSAPPGSGGVMPTAPIGGIPPLQSVDLTVARIAGLAAALSKGLPASFTCPVGCHVAGRLTIPRRTARKLRIAAAKTVTIGSGEAEVPSAGRGTLRLRFKSRARKRLKRLKRVDVTLRASFAIMGSTRVLVRRVTLKKGAPPATAPGDGGGTTTPGGGTTPAQPGGGDTGTGVTTNRPPAFPSVVSSTQTTQFQYDPNTGYLTGVTTTLTVTTPPTDPDGDQLTYTWTATNGTVQGNGLSVTWQRPVSGGQPADGDLTITVTDGRGGSDAFTFQFR